MALLGILLGITMVTVVALGVIMWLNIVVVGKIGADADDLAARVKLLEEKPQTSLALAEKAKTAKPVRRWSEDIPMEEAK